MSTMATQPRVALFMAYLGGGGAERVMFNLASGLVKYGLSVDFVIGKVWGPHIEKVPSEVQVVDLASSSIWQTTQALTRYLKKEQPVALLSAQHYANEMAIWAKHLARVKTRVVVSEHNTLSQSIQQTSKTRKYLIPFLVRYVYPWADGIVTVSQGVAQDLSEYTGLPIHRITTIYNSVLNPQIQEKANVLLEHPWFSPGEPPVILGVGKLEAQKDFPTLIKAFAQVRDIRPARLMILGWGPERPHLEALIQELHLEKDVALAGYVENPYCYMARAKVFVLSSAWEGLPTVLIEAMGVGTPVVSTDCPSGAREILKEGKYGFLSPVRDSKALAESILKVLAGQTKFVDPTWLDQFNSETATQRYLEILGID